MDIIKKIDKELQKQFEKLSEVVGDISLVEIVEFKLEEAKEKIPLDEINYSGIYLLEIKNNGSFDSFQEWVDNFKKEWEHKEYFRQSTPSLKKMRTRAHNELTEFIPLYLGKSKNIGRRIYEHIYKELGKKTFALKLMARQNLKDETFRLSTVKVEVENYDAIVPRIEWQLRNRINPIIGKQ
ncbi:MAG: hypothetical protein LAT68_00020 [Cyclobacteriaceae bacterium]|nr:GIY-YIG nuclease family protein [Cyclobacteriaceae bacterium]MCH8514686.1 hypothetical protein [Cyclobacteriaceae bacterium]